MVVLTTKRLLLRPVQLEDAVQVQPLFAQWGVVKHLNARVPWPFPDTGVLEFYRGVSLPTVALGEEWHWTLRLKSQPGQIIGAISLHRQSALDQREAVHRGFWMGLPWQGQGLMSEAIVPVTDYWFSVLGFPTLRVSKAIDNTASRRISEKTGMRLIGTKESDYVCGRLPTEVWEQTAEEWRAARTALCS